VNRTHTLVVNSVLRHFWNGLTKREKSAPAEPQAPPERRASARKQAAIRVSLRWALLDGEWKRTDGIVRDISRHGFAVEANDPPEPGQSIWIQRAEAPAIRASVRRVEPHEDGWLVALEIIRHEKRRYERQPADGRAKARWLGNTGLPENSGARVVNLSDAGMQVEVEQAPPEGAYVRIVGRHVECAGSLRYCRAIEDGGPYLIGLQFVERQAREDNLSSLMAHNA
jgi:hypothetical protein